MGNQKGSGKPPRGNVSEFIRYLMGIQGKRAARIYCAFEGLCLAFLIRQSQPNAKKLKLEDHFGGLPVPLASAERPPEKESRRSDWKKRSEKKRTSLQMPMTAKPWTSKPGVFLRGVPSSERYEDCLDVSFFEGVKLHGADAANPVHYTIVSNNVDWGKLVRDTIPTFCTGSKIYSFRYDTILMLDHRLALMCFPTGMARRRLTDRDIEMQLGEGCHVGCMALVLLSICAIERAPWLL